ncbi:unnamed protein product [Rotaria sordida]|uniref:G-protein coupled receptors family 1 profile domain-containing protein n=1 Tax=Rotaria sordida TaxID=392033 RepID=A0A815FHW6_9BILA|nr:unnamed protein product [Rotaria sordida]CAF3855355.1 unnamed protein product [Rotaria sordida]
MILLLVKRLEWSSIILNRWIVPITFLTGIIGNLFNLIIFTRKDFLKQSCSLYFLSASINNIIMYLTGLLTRMLSDGFQVNIPGSNSNMYCQIRIYLVYTIFAISNWFLIFASLDRFYSTNQSALKRQYVCSKRMAFKLICLTIIGCILIHIHIIVYYKYLYYINLYNKQTLICTSDNRIYIIFLSLFMLIFYSLLPPLLMLLIGFLTLNNIRKSRRQINSNRMPTLIIRRGKNQLIKTLTVQITLLVILTSPHSFYWIYVMITTDKYSIKPSIIQEYEKFILNIVRILLYINYGCPFYIHMSVSKKFRNEFIKIIDEIKRYFRYLY